MRVLPLRTDVIHMNDAPKSGRNPLYVYVGRGSAWANPFGEGKNGDRMEVIEKYREWLNDQPELLKNLRRLKGRKLVCFCKPFPCHADVLAELADKLEVEETNNVPSTS